MVLEKKSVYTVWFSFEAVITENTFKEQWTNEKYLNDNYNTIIDDTQLYYIFYFFQFLKRTFLQTFFKEEKKRTFINILTILTNSKRV